MPAEDQESIPETRRDFLLQAASSPFLFSAAFALLNSSACAESGGEKPGEREKQILNMLLLRADGVRNITLCPAGIDCTLHAEEEELAFRILMRDDGSCTRLVVDGRSTVDFPSAVPLDRIPEVMRNVHRSLCHARTVTGEAPPEHLTAEGGARFHFRHGEAEYTALPTRVLQRTAKPATETVDPDARSNAVGRGRSSLNAYARALWQRVSKEAEEYTQGSSSKRKFLAGWSAWNTQYGTLLSQFGKAYGAVTFAELHAAYRHTALEARQYGIQSPDYRKYRAAYLLASHRVREYADPSSGIIVEELSNTDDPSHFLLRYREGDEHVEEEWMDDHCIRRTKKSLSGEMTYQERCAYRTTGTLWVKSEDDPHGDAKAVTTTRYRRDGKAYSVSDGKNDSFECLGSDGCVLCREASCSDPSRCRPKMFDAEGNVLFEPFYEAHEKPADYLKRLARLLKTDGAIDEERLSAFIDRFFRYVSEGDNDALLHGAQCLGTMENGRITGDCDNFAFVLRDLLRYMGENAHVISLTMDPRTDARHATCVVLKQVDGKWHARSYCNFGIDHNGSPHGGTADPVREQGYDTPEGALRSLLPKFVPLNALLQYEWDTSLNDIQLVDFAWSTAGHYVPSHRNLDMRVLTGKG